MTKQRVDVCIIGGGPAGSIAAVRLARLGYSVVLVFKTNGQQVQLIESLSPGAHKLISELRLKVKRETGSRFRPSQRVARWASPTIESDQCSEAHVNRGEFDAMLRSAASLEGASVYEGRVEELRLFEENQEWMISLNSGLRIACSFLVDASGRNNRLGGPKRRHGVSTFALTACWQGPGRETSESYIEAGESCWYWGVQLPDGFLRTVAFVDVPADRQILRFRPSRERYFGFLIKTSTLLRHCLDYQRISPIGVCDATVHADLAAVSRAYIKLGDASLTLDPLSSQGIQRAVASALQGAVVINTILRKPEIASRALQFHQSRQTESLREHRRTVSSIYSSAFVHGTEFWRSRSICEISTSPSGVQKRTLLSKDDFVVPSPPTRVVETNAIVGDFVTASKAIEHPSLPGPVGFLNETPVAALLESIGSGMSVQRLGAVWAHLHSDDLLNAVNWLVSNDVVVTRPGPGLLD